MSRKAKYTASFRLAAVQKVLKNNLSITDVCDNLGVSKTELVKWVKYYTRYGLSGLEPLIKNNKYSFDFKLMVIHDIEELGFSVYEVALKYNIPSKSTVKNWWDIYNHKGALGLNKELRGRPNIMNKKPKKKYNKKILTREEELLLENESLRAELALLKKLHALAQAKKKNQ